MPSWYTGQPEGVEGQWGFTQPRMLSSKPEKTNVKNKNSAVLKQLRTWQTHTLLVRQANHTRLGCCLFCIFCSFVCSRLSVRIYSFLCCSITTWIYCCFSHWLWLRNRWPAAHAEAMRDFCILLKLSPAAANKCRFSLNLYPIIYQ